MTTGPKTASEPEPTWRCAVCQAAAHNVLITVPVPGLGAEHFACGYEPRCDDHKEKPDHAT